MSTEVKGLHEYQKRNGAREEKQAKRERPDIKKQTFTIRDLLIDLAKAKVDQLFDNVVRGGRR
jgi:hypothetical protein